jgi:amino acid transporter
MLFLVFYFILFFVLIFQGTHVAGEVKNPLGTVPEEVGQASLTSARWGLLLIGTGFLGLIIGLLGFHWTGLVALRHAFMALGLVVLGLFGLWVIFFGRKAEFVGTPAATDGHDHH